MIPGVRLDQSRHNDTNENILMLKRVHNNHTQMVQKSGALIMNQLYQSLR